VKKNKIWKIIWIVGIYLILATILYLVVLYKVKWEYKDLNTYLYFYECENNLCSSEVIQSSYYSKIKCENDVCPFINNIIGENVILEKDNNMCIYDYVSGNVINDKYKEYRYLYNDLFIVTDGSSKQGVIDINGDVLINPQYEYINDYRDGYVAYRENNLYGINSSDGENLVPVKFNDVVLIDNNKYAGFIDGMYEVYSYNDNSDVSLGTYKYLAIFDDVIFAIYNNKIDVLTLDFNSTLVMKINTFYDYTIEKERDSLNLYSDGEYIYFNVYTNENEYSSYKYSLDSKKLV